MLVRRGLGLRRRSLGLRRWVEREAGGNPKPSVGQRANLHDAAGGGGALSHTAQAVPDTGAGREKGREIGLRDR